jgi:hypothetical protein
MGNVFSFDPHHVQTAATLPVQVMLEMFDQPIHFHPWCARLTNSALAGLLLSLTIRKAQAIIDPEGWGFDNNNAAVKPEDAWFELSVEEINKATGMSRHEQQAAKRTLVTLGLVQSRKAGLPAITQYRVNMPRLMADLEASLQH